MEQVLTAKIQILADPQDKELLLSTMKQYLAACNYISSYVYKTHDLGQASLNRMLYYDIRAQFGLPAQIAQSAIRAVIGSYKTILTNKKPWVKVTYRHGFYDLVWNRDYSLKKDCFSINTLKGRLKLQFCKQGMEKYFADNCTFGSAKVVYKHGKFFLHISVTQEVPDPLPICNVVGIDRGINFLAAAYDSRGRTAFYKGRAVKNKRAAFKCVRKKLQQVRTKSARRRLKRIGQRENRWMSDVNHQISKALVESHPAGTLFVLEDLKGIRNMTERVRKKDRYTQVSWAFFDLGEKLKYKAIRTGSQVIEVNPAYTSQTCPKCGFVHKENRNKRLHVFQCKRCGYQSNDDRVAAMNLYFKGIQYHSTVTTE